MAEVYCKQQSVVLTLELTLFEARTLRGMVQNPVNQNPDDETPTQSELRRAIFEVLKEVY